MNNRWLYRAAGTVGLAGGFLLLAAGGAQAGPGEAGDLDALSLDASLDEVFSPTAGLPVPAGWDAEPEVLPALPLGGLPGLGGLAGLADPSSLVAGLPLDGVTGGSGIDPQLGLLPPLDGLLNFDGSVVGLPTRLPQAPVPVPGLGAFEAATETAPVESGQVEQAELVGPAIFRPFTDSLLGGSPLGTLAPVSGLAGQVPVAGPIAIQTLGTLPLVGDMVATEPPHPGLPMPMPTGDPLGTPAGDLTGAVAGDLLAGPAPAGPQVPAMIGEQLTQEFGLAGEPEVVGGLPLVGPALEPALEPVSKLVGVGNLPSQVPLVGPLAGPLVGDLPLVSPGPAPAAPAPGRHAAEERPIAGDDPAFATGQGHGAY